MVKFGLARYVHRLNKSTLSAREAGRPLILASEESIDDRIIQGLFEDECTTMRTQSYLMGVLTYGGGGYKWGKREGRAGVNGLGWVCLGDSN